MMDMRSGGYVQGGPPPMAVADRHKFAAALDRELTKKTGQLGVHVDDHAALHLPLQYIAAQAGQIG